MGRRLRHWILLGCLVTGLWSVRAQERDWFEVGPFAAEFPTIWETGWRSEALGTIAWWQEAGDSFGWGLLPLLSYEANPVLDREEFDILYPALTWRRNGTERRWQLGQLINIAWGDRQTNDEHTVRRTLFPIYFQQRSASGSNDYLAVLPFYGHLDNRVFRDEVDFVMLPFYVKSRKGEVVTRNYVYPLFHRREGPGLKGWQFWPLVGEEHKTITWRTNNLGDRVLSPGHDKRFALWPIYFDQRNGLGTTNEGTVLTVLPFVALERSPARDETSVLWPLFRRTEDRQHQFIEWGAPWPFIGWADGPGKTARRVWPFYGKAVSGTSRSDFLLWPLYTHRRIEDTAIERDRWRSVFFLYDDIYLQGKETGTYRRERDLWPFFTWKHDLDGRERLQVLAPMETVFHNKVAVERDYSPLWALYRGQSNPKTGTASQSVLWNFFRRDVTTNSVRTACLFGLVQTRRDEDGDRHWRLFWLPNSHFAPGTSPTNAPAARAAHAVAAERRRCDFLAGRPRRVAGSTGIAQE